MSNEEMPKDNELKLRTDLSDLGNFSAYDPNSAASLRSAKKRLLARYGLTDIESQDDFGLITAPGDFDRLCHLQDLLNRAEKAEAGVTPELRLKEIKARLNKIGADDDLPEQEKAEICALLAEEEFIEQTLKNPLGDFADTNILGKRSSPDTTVDITNDPEFIKAERLAKAEPDPEKSAAIIMNKVRELQNRQRHP